jgi:hypothetical protein
MPGCTVLTGWLRVGGAEIGHVILRRPQIVRATHSIDQLS